MGWEPSGSGVGAFLEPLDIGLGAFWEWGGSLVGVGWEPSGSGVGAFWELGGSLVGAQALLRLLICEGAL